MKSRHLIILLLFLNVLSCSSGNSEYDDYIMDLDEYISKKDSTQNKNKESSDSIPNSQTQPQDSSFISNDSISIKPTVDTIEPTIDTIEPTIDTIEPTRKITFMQWNIGHFGNGLISTTITDDDYDEKLTTYQNLLNTINADYVSISEYNVLFAHTLKENNTAKLLFSGYKYNYIGDEGWNRNYSLNAFFTNLSVFDSEIVEYECNQTATITHTNAIKASDYYYLKTRWKFRVNNQIKEILIITTHCAFDNNNKEVALDQVRELIKKFDNEEHVIICGDFNSSLASDVFKKAGYTTANQGEWGNLYTFPSNSPRSCLDNIITKNLKIEDVRVIKTDLSDHLPIICNICI